MWFPNKKDAIIYCAEVLDLHNIFIENKFKIDYNQFICEISKARYSLVRDGILIMSNNDSAKYSKLLFPNKNSTTKLCTYLLHEFNLKYCNKCQEVHDISNFHKAKNKVNGIGQYCIPCSLTIRDDWYQNNKSAHIAKVAEYRAYFSQALPKWADIFKINAVYASRKETEHVDHIIPLKHPLVCGLHVHNNLRCIPAKDNLSKGNRFEIE